MQGNPSGTSYSLEAADTLMIARELRLHRRDEQGQDGAVVPLGTNSAQLHSAGCPGRPEPSSEPGTGQVRELHGHSA